MRVKREAKADEKDAYADVISDDSETALAQHAAARDKLIATLLAEHKELLEGEEGVAINGECGML